MSGQWNRTPRKGEKSINAVRSDHEHTIRIEYRNAGRVDGLVEAWAAVEGVHIEASLRIAELLLEAFPKAGRIALANAGASLAFVDAAENRAAARRRHLREAAKAAKSIGDDIDGA